MTLVEGWLPPSRENWELVCSIWKWFPLVSSLCRHLRGSSHHDSFALRLRRSTRARARTTVPQISHAYTSPQESSRLTSSHTDHNRPMDPRLVPTGQNVHDLYLQPPRPLGVADDGSAWLHGAAIPHVHAAAEGRHRGVAGEELGHGRPVCTLPLRSSLSGAAGQGYLLPR
jgi:hypothetical protein